jgi:hypothetical protein
VVLYHLLSHRGLLGYAQHESRAVVSTLLILSGPMGSFPPALHGYTRPTQTCFAYPEAYQYLNALSNVGILLVLVALKGLFEWVTTASVQATQSAHVPIDTSPIQLAPLCSALSMAIDSDSTAYSNATSHIF